jgi:hypothetical protein
VLISYVLQCDDCSFDGREENDAFFGVSVQVLSSLYRTSDESIDTQFDPIDRDALDAPTASPNKDGVYQCKKHSSASTCFYLEYLTLQLPTHLLYSSL